MGDGRGPAHRRRLPLRGAPKALRAWLRAARGAWYAPVQFYYTSLPGTCATGYQYSSTRLYMLPWYETAPSSCSSHHER